MLTSNSRSSGPPNGGRQIQTREDERRLGEFLAKLVHDLRDPLTPIVGALQLAEEISGEEQQRKMRRLMRRQLEKLVGRVDDLGELALLLQRDLSLNRQQMDLSDAVRTALETTRPGRDGAGLTVDLRLPDGPLYLQADRERLVQAFTSVLEIAQTLVATGGFLSVRVASKGSRAIVRVDISESGVRVGEPSGLFDLFHRSATDKSGTQASTVSSLGAARVLVELHGGAIRAYHTRGGRGVAILACLML